MLKNEIRQRKQILSEYNGNYNEYVNTNEKSMPMIVVIINNYEAYSENYEDEYEDDFQTLTREGIKYGIVYILTASTYSNIRYRLAQNFKQTIALQLNNEDDYLNIYDNIGKKRPSRIFGRGLVTLGGKGIYEFQTAKICETNKWNIHLKEVIEKLNKTSKIEASPIPTLPNKVTQESVKDYLTDINNVPVGMYKSNLEICTYNFERDFINIIVARNIEDSALFTAHIIEEIKLLKNMKINIFDAEKILQSKKVNLNEEYSKFINEIEKTAKSKKKQYYVCIIIGVDKFLSDIDENEFFESLKRVEETEKCCFIIAENATRMKNHEYDEWYKNYNIGNSGIWVGNGIDDQYLISVDVNGNQIINNCGSSSGYVIKQNQATLIKLLEMKEKGDVNE